MMRAVQIDRTGGVEVLKHALKQVPIPKVSPTTILIKSTFAGINFIDTYQRSGLYPVDLPFIPGQDCAGTVEQVGAEVKGFQKGDQVVALASHSYAGYTLAEGRRTAKVNPGLDLDTACAALLQGMTALSLVRDAHSVRQGEVVLVHAAAGGTGLLLCQICRHYGATVIGTTSSEEKAKLAKEHGAHHIVLYNQENWPQQVLDLTPDKGGCHAVFDGVGKSTWEGSMKAIRRKGTLVSFGNASGRPDPVVLHTLAAKNIKVARPNLFSYIVTAEEFQSYSSELFDLMAKGIVKTNIHKEYRLEEIEQGHIVRPTRVVYYSYIKDLTSRGTTGKLLVKL